MGRKGWRLDTLQRLIRWTCARAAQKLVRNQRINRLKQLETRTLVFIMLLKKLSLISLEERTIMHNVFVQDKILLLQCIKKLLDKTCKHNLQPDAIIKQSQNINNKELAWELLIIQKANKAAWHFWEYSWSSVEVNQERFVLQLQCLADCPGSKIVPMGHEELGKKSLVTEMKAQGTWFCTATSRELQLNFLVWSQIIANFRSFLRFILWSQISWLVWLNTASTCEGDVGESWTAKKTQPLV